MNLKSALQAMATEVVSVRREWMDKPLYIATINHLVDVHVRAMRKSLGKFTPKNVSKLPLTSKTANVAKLIEFLNANGTECDFDSVVLEVSQYPEVIEAASLISEDLW